MTLTVKFVIAVIGLIAAILTFFAAVLNTGGGVDTYDPYEPAPQGECVYKGGYDACG
ncbi:hypothetical protein ACFQW6_07225 [Nocardioides sp. GCM10028917]|uniref:hypothetical protein n=1 Tax=Nocardioides sp. GCM10028917 TaxID=3273408 RepID=UPI00360E68EE